jgi:hypothetical protein
LDDEIKVPELDVYGEEEGEINVEPETFRAELLE